MLATVEVHSLAEVDRRRRSTLVTMVDTTRLVTIAVVMTDDIAMLTIQTKILAGMI